jgi:hypothetical protein
MRTYGLLSTTQSATLPRFLAYHPGELLDLDDLEEMTSKPLPKHEPGSDTYP